MKISDLPKEERPRERLRRYGAASLSGRELLAILLRTGTPGKDVLELAAEILASYGGVKGLSLADGDEFLAFEGLGEAKAAVLQAAVELGKRMSAERESSLRIAKGESWRETVSSTALELASEEREYIIALHVRKNGSVIAVDKISYGGLDGAFLDVKYLLRRAVRLDSKGIVLIHNHPDGTAVPSEEDRQLTRFFITRAALLDIPLLGHFIAANGKFLAIPFSGEA